MIRITEVYERHDAYRRFQWICAGCNKTRVKSISEFATINPWNQVTWQEAHKQANDHADESKKIFLSEPRFCAPCRDAGKHIPRSN